MIPLLTLRILLLYFWQFIIVIVNVILPQASFHSLQADLESTLEWNLKTSLRQVIYQSEQVIYISRSVKDDCCCVQRTLKPVCFETCGWINALQCAQFELSCKNSPSTEKKCLIDAFFDCSL